MTDHNYRIEFADCAIETDDREFAEQLISGSGSDIGETPGDGRGLSKDVEHITMTPEHVPMQIRYESGIGVDRLEELCQAWERKSSHSRYSGDTRAAYCDAAEKLRFVLDDTPWMESP